METTLGQEKSKAHAGNLVRVDPEKYPGYFRDPHTNIIYYRKRIGGRNFKISTRTQKISEAKRFVDEFMIGLKREDLLKKYEQEVIDPLIRDLWFACIAERFATSGEATKVRWGTVWRIDLSPFWGSKHASELTEQNVRKYEEWFLKNRPGKIFFSANKYLRMLINYAHRMGHIRKKVLVQNLDKKIDTLARRKTAFRVYKEEEQKALIENAVNERTRCALILFFDTGARKMEVLKIKKDQIDFNLSVLNLWSDKNRKWRKIPMTSRVKEALKTLCQLSFDSEYLFPMATDKCRHLAGQIFDRDWVKTKRKAKLLGRARLHDCRHTFATKCAHDAWPIKEACDVLDMTPRVFLQTYCHSDFSKITSLLIRSFDNNKN
jgi:integrase